LQQLLLLVLGIHRRPLLLLLPLLLRKVLEVRTLQCSKSSSST
jgi:hypothetical protein